MEALWPGRGYLGGGGNYVGSLLGIILLKKRERKRTPRTVFLTRGGAVTPYVAQTFTLLPSFTLIFYLV